MKEEEVRGQSFVYVYKEKKQDGREEDVGNDFFLRPAGFRSSL